MKSREHSIGWGVLPRSAALANNRADRGLWIALVVLLVLRFAVVLGLDVKQTSDMGWYFSRALELLSTGQYAEHGIPTAYWPVGYPAFLMIVMRVFGPSPLVGQVANVMLSAGGLVLLYRFCMQRFGDTRVAGLAALILAVYPNHIGYSVGLFSEPLFTFLLLLVVTLIKPDSRMSWFCLAGILLGCATLVKAQMLALAPLLVFLLALREVSPGSLVAAALRTFVAVLFMMAVILPWTYRNLVVMGAPIPISTNGGMSLLSGNNPSMTTSLATSFDDGDPLFKIANFSVQDQVAADRRAKDAAVQWIRDNPGRFLALMPKKVFRLWAPDGESEWVMQAGYAPYEEHRLLFRTIRWANQCFYVLLLAGCAVGLVARLRYDLSDPAEFVVPLLIAFFTVVSMVFSGQSRYHAPLMPFVISYAAWAFVRLHHLLRHEPARV